MDVLIVSLLYRIYRLEKQMDEQMWKLETVWYMLDTKLFPLPVSKENEPFDDYYLRIPRRLAMRELWHRYKENDRRLKSIDREEAMSQYSRKKDKEAVVKLFAVLETLRDQMHELYWKVRLGD